MAFGIEGQADVVRIVTFPSGLYRAILLIDFQAVKKKIKIFYLCKITGEHFERTFLYSFNWNGEEKIKYPGVPNSMK